MGSLRTINHPGYEQEEIDLSTYASTVGGTTSLVLGFAKQGQSGVAVSPTSKTAVRAYFGTPETEAERYFYYGCAEVFDKGGNLIAARVPYNNAAQNLTPAVQYKIEEYASKHCVDYIPSNGSVIEPYDFYEFTAAADEERIMKFFAYEPNKALREYAWFPPTTGEFAYGDSTYMVITSITGREGWLPGGKDATWMVGDTEGEAAAFVAVVFDSPSASATAITGTVDLTKANHDAGLFHFEVVRSDPDSKVGIHHIDAETGKYTELSSNAGVEYDTDEKLFDLLYCDRREDVTCCPPKFKDGRFGDGAEVVQVFDTSLADPTAPETDVLFYGAYASVGELLTKYANDVMNNKGRPSNVKLILRIFDNDYVSSPRDLTTMKLAKGYFGYQFQFSDTTMSYLEDELGPKANYLYSAAKKQPTLAIVTPKGREPVVAMKSYYGATSEQVLDCTPEKFTEIRMTDSLKRELLGLYGVDSIKALAPYLNKARSASIPSVAEYVLSKGRTNGFQLVQCVFTASESEEYVSIGKDFATAPVTTDVTDATEAYGEIGLKLAIPALNGVMFDQSKYPEVETNTYFGHTGQWLTAIGSDDRTVTDWAAKGDEYGEDGSELGNTTTTEGFNKNQSVRYELVTDFASVSAIAAAGSQYYKWVRWELPSVDKTGGQHRSSSLLRSIMGCRLDDVPTQLDAIENVVAIRPCDEADDFGFIPLTTYQDYRDGAAKPEQNTIVIANITEQRLGADTANNDGEEILGIVPVLVSGFQALPAQSRIELPTGITNSRVFNAVESLVRGKSIEGVADNVDIERWTFAENSTAKPLGDEVYRKADPTYSNNLIATVPSINLNDAYKPVGEAMNNVTLAVCQLALSKVENNKIVMTILETFTGSLDSEATDSAGRSTFIDNIVNSEDDGSSYVRMFTNWRPSSLGYSKTETDKVREVHYAASADNTAVLTVPGTLWTVGNSQGDDEWYARKKQSMSLGFTEEQTKKYISYATITATLESIFDFLSNVDETEIDLVVDAGLSSIANRIKTLGDKDPSSLKFEYDIHYDKVDSVDSVAAWKSICSKYLTFCSTTRKDCMAIIDSPRSLGVKNGTKLVREGGKATVDFDVLPSFNYLAGLNSNYGAGYATWMSYVDDFSGKTIWLPPSIAAEGSMILTDYAYNYWEAPAGKRRGVVTSAVDVAFNPNDRQQDSIYSKSWNYSIRNNIDGVLIWGQKTLTTIPSAFDRINVRRLFLRLERMTRKFLKNYLFEINNVRTRNQIVDGITPVYENVKAMGGLYDYRIFCSERNNTPTVIDNNELRYAVGFKPAKVAEFIYATYVCLSTGMDFSEMEPVL